MKKRTKLIAAAVSLGALMTVGGTLAWFTDSETATNTVTTGYVDLEIQENVPSEVEQIENGYIAKPNEDKTGIIYSAITPGAEIRKEPSIYYTGSVDAYVRYRVILGDSNYDTGFQGDSLARALTLKNGETNVTPSDDGWIYVTDENNKPIRIIADGGNYVEVTDVFDTIEVATEAGNEFANKDLEIRIEAEAIQADNIGEKRDATLDEVKKAFADETNEETGRVDFYDDDKELGVMPLNN